jgi:quinol monooxygenase YgiN
MLIVAGKVVVEEDAIGRAKKALGTMEAETRKESGCQDYTFSIEISDPTVLRIFERWESMAALEAHFATPHMAAFGVAISQIQPKSMDVKVYDVAGELPMPSRG